MSDPNQGFSARQLGWMRRWHSQAHLRTEAGSRPVSRTEWDSFLNGIADQIDRDSFDFRGLHWHFARGKLTLSTSHLEDTLVIRKINDNLRRAYGIRQPNRSALIRTAKQALSEATPKTIIRIDLKGCFEGINRNALLREIESAAKLSTQTTGLLTSLFRKADKRLKRPMPEGIPRGLNISNSLAEIRLRSLDRELRVLPGTYLYLRYVDDLLIFTTGEEKEAISAVRRVIKDNGFRVNEKKTSSVQVGCDCEPQCSHGGGCPCSKKCICSSNGKAPLEVEYLGYKLIFDKHNDSKKDYNEIYCVLSDRKQARIKTRLVRSFRDCRETKDWNLLEDRVRYLTSNQRVAASPNMRGLFNGLSYTHAEYKEPEGYDGPGSLEDLDRFYRAELRRLIGSLGEPPNADTLTKMTFRSGFFHHRRTKFSGKRVLQIQACWES